MKVRLFRVLVIALFVQSTAFAGSERSAFHRFAPRSLRLGIAALSASLALRAIQVDAQEAPQRVEIPASIFEVPAGRKVTIGVFTQSLKQVAYEAGGAALLVQPELTVSAVEQRSALVARKVVTTPIGFGQNKSKSSTVSFNFATAAERDRKKAELERESQSVGEVRFDNFQKTDGQFETVQGPKAVLDLPVLAVFRKQEAEVKRALEESPERLQALRALGVNKIAYALVDRRAASKENPLSVGLQLSADGKKLTLVFGLDPDAISSERVGGGERIIDMRISFDKLIEQVQERQRQLEEYDRLRGAGNGIAPESETPAGAGGENTAPRTGRR